MSLTLIWLAIGLYVVIGLAVAAVARRNLAGGAEEFYLAGRNVTGLVSGASYAATTYSAFMMLGLAGLTYAGGVGALGFELIYFAGLGLVLVFGPRFWLVGHKYGFVTPSEMVGARYGSRPLAGLIAILSCLFLIPYSSVQLLGIGYLLSGATDGAIPFGVGVVLAAGLAVIWTLAAGLRSVVWTDALQAIIILVTALLALWFVVDELGGLGSFLTQIEEERGAWLAQPGPGLFSIATFVGLTLPWFFFSLSNPQVSQRLFTTRDLGAMRIMIIAFLSFGVIFTLISILWGFAALLIVPDLTNADLATPALIAAGSIPAWIAIPLIIGIMAAAITTVDSIVLTLASMIGRDVYRASAPNANDAGELMVGKVVVLVLVAAAALFASLQLELISILSVTSSAGLLVTVPCIIGVFFWRRGTAGGALASVIGGTLTIATLTITGASPFGVPSAVMTFAVSILLFIGISLITRPPADRGHGFIDALRPELDRHRIW